MAKNYLGLMEQTELDAVYIEDSELSGLLGQLGDLSRTDPRRAIAHFNRLVEAHRKKHGLLIQKAPFDNRTLTGKALFEKRLHLLPKDIREKLNDGLLTIADKAIYSVKKATSDHIELFASADAARKGVINLNRAMLPADNVMLLLSITLLSAKTDKNNPTEPEKLSYGRISPVIANGEFTMRAGQQVLFDSVSNEVFNHSGTLTYAGNSLGYASNTGEDILETPKIIEPQQEISFDLDLGETPEELTYIKVILRGITTVKA